MFCKTLRSAKKALKAGFHQPVPARDRAQRARLLFRGAPRRLRVPASIRFHHGAGFTGRTRDRADTLVRRTELVESAMNLREVGGGALLLCLMAPETSSALEKARRTWDDPPPDLAVLPPLEAGSSPTEPRRPDVDATGSADSWPEPVRATGFPQIVDTIERSSCTVRRYTVLSGATIRIHAC